MKGAHGTSRDEDVTQGMGLLFSEGSAKPFSGYKKVTQDILCGVLFISFLLNLRSTQTACLEPVGPRSEFLKVSSEENWFP